MYAGESFDKENSERFQSLVNGICSLFYQARTDKTKKLTANIASNIEYRILKYNQWTHEDTDDVQKKVTVFGTKI